MRSLLVLSLISAAALADVRLPGIFSDDMVVQEGQPLVVWGWAEPGEKVTVEFDEGKGGAITGKNGRWRVQLKAFDYRAARKLVVAGKNRIELSGVCVGEVWVCSGQSNMQWPVRASANAPNEIAEAHHPRIRLFSVPRRTADKPLDDVKARWQVCTPATIPNFSAVAYYFARAVREQGPGVPFGLIHTSWGGTPAESWVRRAALDALPAMAPTLKFWDGVVAGGPAAQRAFQPKLATWKKKAAAAKKLELPAPRRPRPPLNPRHPHRPSSLYHAMIAPLTPFPVRGVIWYQGESNAGRAAQYRTLFPALIRDWRAAWGRELPFYFVQLANFRAAQRDPGESAWAELREAQRLALREPKTGMAVILDIGNASNIHPKNKQDVGRRLAQWALRDVYGKKEVVPSGPLLTHSHIRDRTIVLTFRHAGGLAARGGDPLTGFTIAGADRKWRWAHARIEGGTVVVSHPRIAEPAAVRYAWADNPRCNLINGAGLPASSFRTDDWAWTTAPAPAKGKASGQKANGRR